MKKILEKYRSMPIAIKASGWYMACNIFQNALGFITLPIFTRILTTEEYGLYSIYLTWMNLLVIFTTLNLQYGVFNTAMIKYEDSRDKYISAMQGLTTVISLLWLVIYVVAHGLWDKLFGLPTIVMIAMAIEMLFLPAKDFWCGKQRFEYKYKEMVLYTVALMIINPLIAILAILAADNERGVIRILAAVAVNVVFYGVIYVRNFCKGKTFYHKEYWKYALEFGLPLIMYYLSQMIFNQSDKLMIQHMEGLDKAGIYSLIYSCSVIIVFVINAINSAFVPWKYEKLKNKSYEEIGKVSFLLAFAISVILYLVVLGGPEIVKIVATEEYYEAIWIMPPVIASLFFLFLSQLFINIEFYFEEKRALVIGALISAILNIVLNYFAISWWGYIAAGYTTLIAYIAFAFTNYFYMKKLFREKMGDCKVFPILRLSALGMGFLLLCMLTLALYPYVYIRWGILIAICILVLINYKKLLPLIKRKEGK